MHFKRLWGIAVLLLCGMMLCASVSAADTGRTDLPEDSREEAYLVLLQRLKLDERYQGGRITLEEYFEEKEPLDEKARELGSPFALAVSPEGLPAYYRTLYNDVQYQKRINGEKREELENTYQNHQLAAPAYYSRRLRLERRAQELEQEQERILWESQQNPQGQGRDTEILLWKARYRIYRNTYEQELLESAYRAGKLDKQRFTERREQLQAEAKRAQASNEEAEREEEKYRLRAVVPEKDYNEYWNLEKRLAEIEKELKKLEEQLRSGQLGSRDYQDQKRALETEREQLQEEGRTTYRGYEDDSRMKN